MNIISELVCCFSYDMKLLLIKAMATTLVVVKAVCGWKLLIRDKHKYKCVFNPFFLFVWIDRQSFRWKLNGSLTVMF